MYNAFAPDLTQHPPRSGRVTLGGYAHLPRLLDKARAHLNGKVGEYHYNCPLDQEFFEFTGIDQEVMLAEIKKGGSDSDVLAWVTANTKVLDYQIKDWSAWLTQHGPAGTPGHHWMADTIAKCSATRSDIRSFFDLLDMDDYVSYGGKA